MHKVISNSSTFHDEYDSLVSKLKQMRRECSPLRAPAIAVVSFDSGAGVSSVTKAITDRMNAGPKALRTADVTVSFTAEEAMCATGSAAEFVERIFDQHEADLESVFNLAGDESSLPVFERGQTVADFEGCLSAVRNLFRFALIECLPLKTSADIVNVAPLVDAVLIVVEANKTTRQQTEQLADAIETAGGTILGCVLNKQTFPIPSPIYQICEKVGLI